MEPLGLPPLKWLLSVLFMDGLSEWIPSVWIDYPSNWDNLDQVIDHSFKEPQGNGTNGLASPKMAHVSFVYGWPFKMASLGLDRLPLQLG